MNTETYPLLIAIAGVSGAGKSTLCDNAVVAGLCSHRVVTVTSRPPREGETDGISYHFWTAEKIMQGIAAGLFIEYECIHGQDDDRIYGTLRESIIGPLRKSQTIITNMNVDGIESLRREAETNFLLRSALTTIFMRLDRATMMERLQKRGMSREEIDRRIISAQEEVKHADKFEYSFESRTIDEDLDELRKIMVTKRGILDMQ